MSHRHKTFVPFALSLLLTSCRTNAPIPPVAMDAGAGGGDTAAAIVCPSNTGAMQKQLFEARCGNAGCHGTVMPALALDLTSGNLEARLVGVASVGCRGEKLVVAGQPEQSELYRKVAHAQPECGVRMPVGTSPFSEQELECLRRWIVSLSVAGPPDAGVPDGTPAADAGSGDVPSGLACPSGQTACGGACVALQVDNGNCGACGRACGAGETCRAGSCVCTTGLSACGGTCVDLASNASHCGACGKICGSGTLCAAGACVRGGCPSGTVACAGACVDTRSSASNCGACGTVCASGRECVAGTCTCASGTTACNGSCVNTSSDARNCGACGKVCGSGEVCKAGICAGCGPAVSFANQVQPIFNASCTTACHGGNRPAGNLSLVAGVAYAGLVNVTSTCNGRKHVAPGAAQNSYLINKLIGVDMCSGSVMPKAGGELSAAQIDVIRAWICQGAPKN